jgi:hypothetical protein
VRRVEGLGPDRHSWYRVGVGWPRGASLFRLSNYRISERSRYPRMALATAAATASSRATRSLRLRSRSAQSPHKKRSMSQSSVIANQKPTKERPRGALQGYTGAARGRAEPIRNTKDRTSGSSLPPNVTMKRGRSESQWGAEWGHSTSSSHGTSTRRSPTRVTLARLLQEARPASAEPLQGVSALPQKRTCGEPAQRVRYVPLDRVIGRRACG